MTAKAYKTKMAEPVVRKLKQLVKTVLARCFEGWDNYHRLNTANAQLYRTNQRLEKVNERLTEENKILKAENKDYSLLRKVFGRKQIDDLLEQARNCLYIFIAVVDIEMSTSSVYIFCSELSAIVIDRAFTDHCTYRSLHFFISHL